MAKLPEDAIAEQLRGMDQRITALVQSIRGRFSTGPILFLTLLNTVMLIAILAYIYGANG